MPRFCDDRRHSCVEPKAKSRNAAQFITPGITPKFRRPQVCRSPTLVVDVRLGSFASVLACPQHVRLGGNLGNAGCPVLPVEGIDLGVIQVPKPEPRIMRYELTH